MGSFRCWWKRDLKLPFSPIPSNKTAQERHLFLQPSPAEAWLLHRAWNSCCFWLSRSPIQARYTSQDGQHHTDAPTYPSCFPRSLGPVTGNLNFHLSQQVSRPCSLCSSWCTHSCSTDQPQGIRQQELQQGKAGIPNNSKDTWNPKSAEHKTLPLQGNKRCWHHYWSLFCKALSNKFKHFESVLKQYV